jgi:hypothetical protein
MNRPSDATWRAQSGAKYRYCVDLIPPPEGFSDEVDEEIIEFVERCSGTFDLCGEITDRVAFVRYCFEQAADAEAFHDRFARAAEKAILKKLMSIYHRTDRSVTGARPLAGI